MEESNWGVPIQMAVMGEPKHPKYECWMVQLTIAVIAILQMCEDPQTLVDATDIMDGEYPVNSNFTMWIKGLSIRKRLEEVQ